VDDYPYYLRQWPNTFPVVPVSTLSAPIASSNIVSSHSVPTVSSRTAPPQLPKIVLDTIRCKNKFVIWHVLYSCILSIGTRLGTCH